MINAFLHAAWVAVNDRNYWYGFVSVPLCFAVPCAVGCIADIIANGWYAVGGTIGDWLRGER